MGVRLCNEPNFAKTKKLPKGSKRKGLLYQERVVERLETMVEDTMVPLAGPWFEFVDATGHRYAQADWIGIDLSKGFVCIAEVKLNRVPDAWWQLNRLYLPLVERLFPEFDIGCLEIATTICNFQTPDAVELVTSLSQVEKGTTKFLRMSYD